MRSRRLLGREAACANMSASTWSLSFRISARFVTVVIGPTCTAMLNERPTLQFAERALWNIDSTADRPQSALMLRARITLPHFSVSAAIRSSELGWRTGKHDGAQ